MKPETYQFLQRIFFLGGMPGPPDIHFFEKFGNSDPFFHEFVTFLQNFVYLLILAQ